MTSEGENRGFSVQGLPSLVKLGENRELLCRHPIAKAAATNQSPGCSPGRHPQRECFVRGLVGMGRRNEVLPPFQTLFGLSLQLSNKIEVIDARLTVEQRRT